MYQNGIAEYAGSAVIGKDGKYDAFADAMSAKADFTNKKIDITIKDPNGDWNFGGDINGNVFAGQRNGIYTKGGFYGFYNMGGMFNVNDANNPRHGTHGVFGGSETKYTRTP